MTRIPSRRAPRLLLETLEDRLALSASPVGNLVVFGDSLSDVGNVALATTGALPPASLYFDTSVPGVPLPLTRFSGGPVWAESLAEALGEPAVLPSLLGGYNYSFGGASLVADPIFPGVPTVGQQVGLYLAGHSPAADDLFALWAGANDFFSSSSSSPTGTPIDPSVPAFALVDQVATLAAAGGKRFVVNALPPLGDTPYFQDLKAAGYIDDATVAGINAWAAGFNAYLAYGLAGVQAAYPDTIVVTVDTLALFQALARPDNALGFTDWTHAVGPYTTSAGSLLTSITAANPSDHLFWDSVHPGERAHEIIGLNAAAGVLSALNVNHLTVTTTADALDPLDGGRSLREMLAVADLMPGTQTITFALGSGAKTIRLGGTDLDVADDVRIVGPASGLTISGRGRSRVFDVAAGADVTVSRMTLTDGKADQGGAVRNAGELTLVGVVMAANSARQGGAVFTTGTLHVFGGAVVGNTASGAGAAGGGVAVVGASAEASLFGVTVANNRATGVGATGGGAAVLGGASLYADACLIVGNAADGFGGGVYAGVGSTFRSWWTLVAGNRARTVGNNVYRA